MLWLIFAAAAAAPASPAGQVITNPDWLRKPSVDDLMHAWPGKMGLEARAVIKCRVSVDGLLEACEVVSETPPGTGAGAAALTLAAAFQMRPKTIDGKPVAGGTATIPIRFSGGPGSGEKIQMLVRPLWTAAPTAAETAAAYPKGATAIGHVVMQCRVTQAAGIERCQVTSSHPGGVGFSRGALALAPRFRLLIDTSKPVPWNLRVTVPVTLDPPSPEPRYITSPDWRRRPTSDQVIAVYPEKAIKDGVSTGHATVECVATAEGALTHCQVVEETPTGEDFGSAAAGLAAIMTIASWTGDGRPVDGAHIRIPFRLNYDREADEAKPQTP